MGRRVLASRVAVAVVALASTRAEPARAHAEPLAGRAPFVVGSDLVGGASTWGVTLREGDRWLRVCEEALGEGASSFVRTASGRVLYGTPSGLRFTDDGGCTTGVLPAPPPAQPVTAAAAAPGVVFVATGRAGFPNGVYRSLDEGATFQPTGLYGGADPLYDLAVSGDGARVFASGRSLDGGPLLYASGDGGATWSEPSPGLASMLAEAVDARVVGVDVDGASAVLALLSGTGQGELLVVDPALQAATRVAVFDVGVRAFAAAGGRRAALTTTRLLHVQGAPGEPFVAVEGGATDCLFAHGGAFWGCGRIDLASLGVGQFTTSQDGLAWSTALGFDGVEERVCPEGTAARALCARYAEDAGPAAVDGGVDAAPPASDAGRVGPAPDDDAGDAPSEDGAPSRDGGVHEQPTPACACGAARAPDARGVPVRAAALVAAAALWRLVPRRRRRLDQGCASA